MFNFIFHNNLVQWCFRAIIVLMFIFFLKNYFSFLGNKHQSDSNLRRGKHQMIYFGLSSMVMAVFGYFAKLYLLGAPAFFFTTNPFLFIILRTDNTENQMILKTIFPGIIEGLIFLMNGTLIFILACLLSLIFNSKINKIKFAS